MIEQRIALEIKDKSLTKLAGNSYGRKLFNEQVNGKIDLEQPFVIEFPEQIYTEIGREGMEKNFDIIAPKIDSPKRAVLNRLMLM